ncbi:MULTISPECIES: shikimate kinase [unclassified Adlercreutzia]|uniref:shikimate kinase n=1 Tax=unclassified Adlercreutzia TaxID=2636013 RepID=UPI0013EAED11|nr:MULTISPECIES: shikimate kinase [unclassified Adlercreutzia]
MHENSTEQTRNNIVLIGMPGVGKSTIGVVLAKILNYEFVDADLIIQQRCDKTLQRLIDTLGPDGFIEVEGKVLADLEFKRAIISTGGSAIYSHEGMQHLAKNGRVVYLKVELEELESRFPGFDERGVVMRRARGMSLADLYEERIPLYEKYADITVNVDGLSITEAADKVIKALQ